ncbi:MAG: UDP-N-acetylglucosamine 2-epimerase (non-hydrolyzing) [Flavobacteriales bacterium]
MGTPRRMLTVVGARPQIIKAAAISRAVQGRYADRIKETILHSGQHYDANMSRIFFEELGIPAPERNLRIAAHSPSRTARMLEGIEQVIDAERPDLVLVYGDTDTTLATALAASKAGIPLAHVEAGLRSFDRTMPEEVNRIVCDHCSSWLFCPTDTAVQNLRREGFDPAAELPKVVLAGDVMFDNSLYFAALAERSTILKENGLQPDRFALATVHRAHNTDDPERLSAILGALLELHRSTGLTLAIPLHPRTRQRIERSVDEVLRREFESTKGIVLMPPVGYLDMIALQRSARLVLTDSGGLQKEAFFFGKPCLVLRAGTEWTELVDHGYARLVDHDRDRMIAGAEYFLTHDMPPAKDLFGNGDAAGAICQALSS